MYQKNTKTKKLLTVAMLLCFCALTNVAIGQTWDIGNPGYNSSVRATLSDGFLIISGTGNMCDFWDSTEGEAPWYANRTSIKTVVIQSGVMNIGNRAFHDCSNLDSIDIPNTVTIIGRQAFFNCTNFLSVIIPNSVTEIEGEAFKNCINLRTVIIDEGNATLNFSRYDAGYYDYKYDWFENCPIQTLNLRRQYSYNGGVLFSGNSYLQTLTIGRNVTQIESYAFADCGSLSNVILEDGSTDLMFGSYNTDNAKTVFSGCPIRTLYLGREMNNGSRVMGFSDYVRSPFYNKTTLQTLTVGNSIPIVGYAFQNCINLGTVNIGNNVTSIGAYVFDGCSKLSNLTIGNSVTSIGDAAFRNCSALKNVSIPKNVSSLTIGSYTFADNGLTSITIPNIITHIGGFAFANCSNLTTVILEDGSANLVFGSNYNAEIVFGGCPINTLYLGRNIYTYEYGSARPFSASTSYRSPFYNKTTLQTLTVGKDITSITDYTFHGCNGLTKITSNNPAPPTFGTNTFNGVITTIPVHVPCVLAYQSSAWGTAFSNFVQTGTCPSSPTAYTLNVLSSNIAYGHATSTSMSSGAVLTSTWNFEGNLSTTTSAQFSGKAILTASAKANSLFLGWDDGNLEPMRIVDLTTNKTYTARFASSTGVDRIQSATDISVYPNPAKDYIVVEFPENTIGTLALFDLNGKIFINQSVNCSSTTINTSSLSAGTYILRLVQDGVASDGLKIMKE